MLKSRLIALNLAVFFFVACVTGDETRPATQPAPLGVNDENVAVYFSPHGGCSAAIIDQIKAAKKTIDVQAYSFTSAEIAHAVAEAHDRGVKVRVILDKRASSSQYSEATYFANHGVETWIDGKHPIAHNKIILIDGTTIITGSFNFTKQAESNAENVLIITGHADLAEAYEKNFEEHMGHSKKYEGAKTTTHPATQPANGP